jgi:hypothetical protein
MSKYLLTYSTLKGMNSDLDYLASLGVDSFELHSHSCYMIFNSDKLDIDNLCARIILKQSNDSEWKVIKNV